MESQLLQTASTGVFNAQSAHLPVVLNGNSAAMPTGLYHLQAYELVQGPLVRWSEQQMGQRPPPTAVMVHGILGSRKNMHAYARRLVEVRFLFGANMIAMPSHAETCFGEDPRT